MIGPPSDAWTKKQLRARAFRKIIEPAALCRGLIAGTMSASNSRPADALARLLGGLISVTAHPCIKGRFFDAMEDKLAQLAQRWSNELVAVDFPKLIDAVLSASRLVHSTLKPETNDHHE